MIGVDGSYNRNMNWYWNWYSMINWRIASNRMPKQSSVRAISTKMT